MGQWNLCVCTSTPASVTTAVSNAPSVSEPGQACTALSNNVYGLTDESCMPCATGQQFYPCDSATYTWSLCICSASLAQHGDQASAALLTAFRRHRLRSHHHVLTPEHAFVQILSRLARAQDLLEERREEF